MPTPYHKRLSQAKRIYLTEEIEALLLFDLLNIRYLTGFTGSDGALLVLTDKTFLLVDGRYTTQARQEAKVAEVVEYREKMEGIAETVLSLGIKKLGFEAEALSVADYEKLKERLPSVYLRTLAEELRKLRSVKDNEEIEFLRQAATFASKEFYKLLPFIKPGLRERDIALELEYRLRLSGAEGISFPTIVASGENSSLPHAKPGDRILREGDVVVIDFGISYAGYHSDETCTLFLAEADARKSLVYGIVKEAHDRAISAVCAGVACSEIDRLARDYIRKKGWAAYFPHGTGHGIGLDVHESPRIAPPSRDILEEGMVITVEPGIYLPGEWGVRIEDMVLVQKEGCEVLTGINKELTIL